MALPAHQTINSRPLIAIDGLELSIPECEKGIGSLISTCDSPQLIAGVQVERIAVHPDDRGYFLEVQRIGQGLAASFDPATTQVSAALSYSGAVKAFHFHLHQTDCWVPVKGLFQVALADLRPDSSTFGRKNTMYVGPMRPWRVLIPPGVAHGYKVVSPEDAMLVYLTNRFYNPEDEGRIPYNDAFLNYDWTTQWK